MAPCPRWKQRPLATAAVCWVLVVALLTARPASAQVRWVMRAEMCG